MSADDILDDAPTEIWPRPSTPPPPPSEAEVLTADEVAEILRVDRKTVYDAAGRGALPHRRVGKRLVVSRAALLDWLACKSASKE